MLRPRGLSRLICVRSPTEVGVFKVVILNQGPFSPLGGMFGHTWKYSWVTAGGGEGGGEATQCLQCAGQSPPACTLKMLSNPKCQSRSD